MQPGTRGGLNTLQKAFPSNVCCWVRWTSKETIRPFPGNQYYSVKHWDARSGGSRLWSPSQAGRSEGSELQSRCLHKRLLGLAREERTWLLSRWGGDRLLAGTETVIGRIKSLPDTSVVIKLFLSVTCEKKVVRPSEMLRPTYSSGCMCRPLCLLCELTTIPYMAGIFMN